VENVQPIIAPRIGWLEIGEKDWSVWDVHDYIDTESGQIYNKPQVS